MPLQRKNPVFLNGKKSNVPKMVFLYSDLKNRIKVTHNTKTKNAEKS